MAAPLRRAGSAAALQLTAVRFVTRSLATAAGAARARPAHLARLTPDDVAALRGLFPADDAGAVLTAPDDVARYNVDWLRQHRGASGVVVRPRSTADVAAALALCHDRRLAVVPHGGNTGLVGGSVPIWDEVVLSLERLNAVLSFDAGSGVLVAQAGCVLEALDGAVAPHGFQMPLDLGAKGSCQIGGNVSTNAGGLRYLRYGSLHGSVLGLQAVLADGTLIDALSGLRKDNVGYDVKQLFIGSEGTLGVVTAVALQTVPRPAAVNVGLFGCRSFDACVGLVAAARRHLGEVLSAAELVDGLAMATLTDVMGPGHAHPLAGAHPFYVLLETHGSRGDHDAAKLAGLLEAVTGDGTVDDGVVAQDDRQARALWRLREGVPVALAQRGHVFKYDVSLPLAHFYRLVEDTRARLAPWADSHGVAVVGYGHLGDANVHLNVSTPHRWESAAAAGGGGGYHQAVCDALEPWVYEWVLNRGGSISAEHGLGQAKAHWLPRAKPAPVVALMAALKAALDPRGILNPGKVLPP
jgi:(R)-2-hydroxyglutarate---pyruvate transhydrogenase